MEQEIVNSLWFLAPATKKARYFNEIVGFFLGFIHRKPQQWKSSRENPLFGGEEP